MLLVTLKTLFKGRGKESIRPSSASLGMRSAMYLAVLCSIGVGLMAATTINLTTNAIAYVTQKASFEIRITIGKTLNVLQWLAFGFSIPYAIGLWGMFVREGGTLRSTGMLGGESASKHSDSSSAPLPEASFPPGGDSGIMGPPPGF